MQHMFKMSVMRPLLVASVVLIATGESQARLGRIARRPDSAPIVATPAVGAMIAGSATSCRQPCITYNYRGGRTSCGCERPIQTVLAVQNPCSCCPVTVPVCIPGCCVGEPKVCTDRGLFGRHIVWYEWCCGFSVKITFKRSGDMAVTYVSR